MNSAIVVASGLFVLSTLSVVFWSIWKLSRSSTRPNFSFGSWVATVIGVDSALSGVLLFHWPPPVIVLIGGLTVYAGALWLWSMTARQPDRSTS